MAKRRKVRRKKVMRKAVRRARRAATRRAGALSSLSTVALAAELQRRQNEMPALRNREAELMAELDSVRAELDGLGAGGGAPGLRRRRGAIGRTGRGGSGRKRPKNDANLETYLARVLKGKTMGVTEVAIAVKRAGYRTTSPNFRTIVNQTLIKSDKIKKLARGKYTAA
ncbi:MAG: hypothetical protein KIS87_00900 [Phycisphaeraceae bacterium]|nr:hypothetical protein [Phycisphaeraceae bacterium]